MPTDLVHYIVTYYSCLLNISSIYTAQFNHIVCYSTYYSILTSYCDLTTAYTKIEDTLTSTATKIIGKYRKKKQPWMTNYILDLLDKIRTLKSAKKGKPELNDKYREINIEIRNLIIRTKDNWIQTQCKLIDEDMKFGIFSKRAYETLRTLTKTAHRQSSIIEDKQGKPFSEEQALVNRWTEYCQELYNHPINADINVLQLNSMDQDDDLPILKYEVINTIKSLKIGKSHGNDNIPSELLGGDAIVNVFTELCQKSWYMKKWTAQWTQYLVIPIPKKGNLRKCENYRTLRLISHSSKKCLRIILNRLNPQVERILSDEQAGFRKGRSTVEHIFNCRILMERHIESQMDL